MLVSWNTTNACNLRCPHCYRDAGQKAPQELTTAEGCELIEEVWRSGFRIMVFSGGEPLLRPDLFDLIDRARSRGLRPVLGTNGTLITREVARDLKKAGAAAVGISIDSIDREKHDRFRGVDGAWEATMEGIENCRAEGLPFQIHSTVFPWNYGEITDVTSLALQVGAHGHHVFFFVPTGRGRGNEESVAAEQVEDLLERLLSLQERLPLEIKPTCAPQFLRIARQKGIKTRFKRGCLAGISYCIIAPEGDVYPCPYLDLSVGNVRETPFSRIWENNPVLLRLRTRKYEGYCGICRYRGICGGCRARAYAGPEADYMAEDRGCLYLLQEESKVSPLGTKLLLRLQEGFPLEKEPYAVLARELGVTEKEVLFALRWLKARGAIRRLGAIFDSRGLGYRSTLCAASVPEDQLEKAVAIINSYPGVTHNYLREHRYNLWFTVTASSERALEDVVEEICKRTGIQEIYSFPSRKVYKIGVKFPEEELARVFSSRTGCVAPFTV
ncbi:radical SAM domain-containing protein [Thermacetogenium phaeum DSM 12270]|uniref:Radical SAM domain-containing protein n=1 Tax=Thermacetogenium phaeum (strain ATCC BAA-254 / DSM 26808 / PB) TaxID=1089553 RepID=K4LIE2_THEPS|nr:putative heme d1 biosynthesis radical SAM protein NirJ2 [Thermacetogenium phaeum]AFV11735.1 radical SAM domain-containing protein [Thermacetogenium phaeum DSM 12270]